MDGRERMVLTQRDARQHEPGADSQPTDIRARQLHADASDLGTDVRRLTAPACLESLMLRQAQQNGKCLAILSDDSLPRMGVLRKHDTKERLMITKLTITAAAIVLGMGIVRPISWAAEGDQGRAYYLRYCGSCHGVEGKGDGTVSRSLKVKPADLTQLQKKNKGVFPLEKVIATIDGKTRIGAHGESKMPVWGEIFEKEASAQKEPATTSAARVKVIAEYVSTIQR
jgi:mono/diheme cytochrome c family protein